MIFNIHFIFNYALFNDPMYQNMYVCWIIRMHIFSFKEENSFTNK